MRKYVNFVHINIYFKQNNNRCIVLTMTSAAAMLNDESDIVLQKYIYAEQIANKAIWILKITSTMQHSSFVVHNIQVYILLKVFYIYTG